MEARRKLQRTTDFFLLFLFPLNLHTNDIHRHECPSTLHCWETDGVKERCQQFCTMHSEHTEWPGTAILPAVSFFFLLFFLKPWPQIFKKNQRSPTLSINSETEGKGRNHCKYDKRRCISSSTVANKYRRRLWTCSVERNEPCPIRENCNTVLRTKIYLLTLPNRASLHPHISKENAPRTCTKIRLGMDRSFLQSLNRQKSFFWNLHIRS